MNIKFMLIYKNKRAAVKIPLPLCRLLIVESNLYRLDLYLFSMLLVIYKDLKDRLKYDV